LIVAAIHAASAKQILLIKVDPRLPLRWAPLKNLFLFFNSQNNTHTDPNNLCWCEREREREIRFMGHLTDFAM
jgi:hypothetical protein